MSAAKDRPQSRPATPEFLSNYDRIFRPTTKEPAMPTTLLDGETYTAALHCRMQERDQLAEQNEAMRTLVDFLWEIIDDIDTYGDMAKADDKLYRSLVERRQKERWKTGITTDGYELDLNLPSLAESVLKRRDASVLRRAADHFDHEINLVLGEGRETLSAIELRRLAAEIEGVWE